MHSDAIHKNSILSIYYLLLMIILVSWTNVDNLPPFFLRLLFLMAVVLPLWCKRSRLFVQIFMTFTVTSASSYAVSYMPVDGLYILLTIIISIFMMSLKRTGALSVPTGLIILCLLSAIIDFGYSQTITVSYHWLAVILIAAYMLKRNDTQQLKYIVLSLSVVSLILSLEFIIVGDRFIRDVSTIAGEIDRKGWTDPNYFGTILGMSVVAALIELLTNSSISRQLKWFHVTSAIISLYTLFSVASRGAFVSLACSVVILIMCTPIKWKNKIWIFLGGLAAILVMYYSHVLDLLILRFMSDAGDVGGRTGIWSTRISAFFSEYNVFQWLFGIGSVNSLTLGTGRVLGFHNDFLSVLIRYGFVGLFSLFGLLLFPVIKAPKKRKVIVFAATIYLVLCMSSIEPFTGGQWGALYFYLYILMLSQMKYADNKI